MSGQKVRDLFAVWVRDLGEGQGLCKRVLLYKSGRETTKTTLEGRFRSSEKIPRQAALDILSEAVVRQVLGS